MRTSRLTVPFEIKSVSDDGTVEGYGSVFNNVDYGYDKILPGAFKDTLRSLKGAELPMLWQHDGYEPVGIWHDFAEDKKGLYVEGELNLSKDSGSADVPLAWKARALAKQRAVKGLSIGYRPVDYGYEDEVRVLKKIDLVEVSMVTFPMNPKALLTGVKGLSNKEFVQIVREHLGLSREAAEALRADGLKGLRNYIGSRQSGDVTDGLSKLLNTIEGLVT